MTFGLVEKGGLWHVPDVVQSADRRLWLPPCRTAPRERIGDQVPCNFHAPAWIRTAGDDAIALGEACGVFLLPWQQLAVRNLLGEDDFGRFLAFQAVMLVPRQNGKNVVLLVLELAHLFLFGSEQLVHTAHQFKTARGAFRDLRKVIEANSFLMDEVKSILDSSVETAIVLKDGRRIDFLARSNGSGRGYSGDLVVFDEAYKLDPMLVDDLLPTLSARPNPQVIYASSTGFDYSEVLISRREDALERPEENRHLLLMEWCAKNHKDWRSWEAAAEANPSLGWYQKWDWIREVDLKGLTEDSYKRERLGLWADHSGDAAIGVERWVVSRADPEVLLGVRVVRRSLALEVDGERELAVVAGASELADGRVIVDILQARSGVAWVVDFLKPLVRKHKPYAGVVVDAFSGAAALTAALERAGIRVGAALTKDVAQGTAAFFDGLVAVDEYGDPAPMILHGEHPLLDDAAHTARKRLMGSSKTAWTWEPFGGVKVEPLRAVTLAVRGFEMEPVEKKRRRVA